jgi:hypothetical protein
MGACSPVGFDREIDSLTILIGRLYQIRDDYKNLMSEDVIAAFYPLYMLLSYLFIFSILPRRGSAKTSTRANILFL